MDFDKILADIQAILVSAATGLIEGAREDIELAMGELAEDLSTAIMRSDQALLDVTVARIRLLGERQRLAVNATAMGVLQDVARTLFSLVKEILLP
ncbi:MAG: hypothetical protein JXQ29_08385 [Planctomycetes bacterium]|nr:hypothetical protein [Planctomycetota bacterium]